MLKENAARKKMPKLDPNVKNCHHLLWQARHWNTGSGKLLRNHEYMERYLPRDTLHRDIHDRIADIPMPSEDLCARALAEINRRLETGEIDLVRDTAEKRIDLLLDVWRFDECPRTVLALRWQREIIANFYRRGG